jgi:zinc transport system substrate-binding protein
VFAAFTNAAASSSERKRIQALATIRPIHSLLAGVMEGVGQPYLLIKNGSPHHFSLRPSSIRVLRGADLIVRAGPPLEHFLTASLSKLAARAIVISMNGPAGISKHGAHDAHPWLDPQNAIIAVRRIADELSRLDAKNAGIYSANAERMVKRLREMTNELRQQLSPIAKIPFLTWHNAWEGFARRFGLNLAGSILDDPQIQPGLRTVMQIRNRIKEGRIACIFTEPGVNSSLARRLAQNGAARLGRLYPLGADLKTGPELYFSLMRKNASSLLHCLSRKK